jgi:hypothetical protein
MKPRHSKQLATDFFGRCQLRAFLIPPVLPNNFLQPRSHPARHYIHTLMKPPCDEAAIGSRAAGTPCPETVGRWVLAATILASSMAFIDSTVVNVAIPALQTTFGATVVDVQWVVEAYGLTLAALILVGGSVGLLPTFTN